MDEERDNRESDITSLLRAWCAGNRDASEELLRLTYNRLRLVAGSCMKRERPDHTLQPTALVAELYLRLASANQPSWNNRDHFYSFCARTMRWILADHARSRLREKRKLDLQIPLSEDIPWLGTRDSDISDLEFAMERLEAVDRRKVQALELRIYLGCTLEETAAILHLSKASVKRDLTFAQAYLFRELRPKAKPEARAGRLHERSKPPNQQP